MPPAAPRPPASPRQRGPRSSPYTAGGRRSTDDLFASSSLINQSQLPEWLSPRPPRAQKPATPPAERSGPQRPAAPRPAAERPSDAERDAHLPDWLRAMDPGAPPDLSSLSSGSLRSGGRPPTSSYRAPAPDRRGPSGGPTSGADPFSISRVDAALPPLEGFGAGNAGVSGASGRPPAGAPDPFASRPPFNQPPSSQPQRPGDSFPGAKKGLEFPEFPEFPSAGSPRPGSAAPAGSWRPEQRSGPPLNQSAGGFSAGSLIDKSALPEWLQRPDQSASAPARPQEPNPLMPSRSFDTPQTGASTPGAAGQSGSSSPAPLPSASSPFDGASLVDEASLPDWLRSSSETEPLPLPFTVSESVGRVTFGSENKSSAAPAGDAGAADDDALPEWLQRVYSEANVPPLDEDKPSAFSGPQKISGSDLLDARSVPNWIKEAAQTSPLANISDILAFTPPANPPEGASGAGAQPAPPAPTSGPLSAQSLIDEGELPEWLRNMGHEGASSSALEPGAAREGSASGIFSAAELVDTHMLPAWMKESEPPSGAAGSMQPPGASGSVSGLFSAAELIDTHALPAWLQDQDPKAAPSSTSGAENAGPTGSASGLFSASELVDTAALPVWMKAQESPGAPQAAAAPESAGPTGSASGLFSAAELVDTAALPVWLKDQGPPTGSMPAASSGSPGQSGPAGSTSGVFSASELVDTAALPVWMKAQDPGSSQTSGGSGALTGRPPGSKITPMPAGFSGQQTGAFSAAELVDTKALPAWLKDAGGESGAAASGGQDTLSRDTEGRMAAAELVDTSALPAWLGGTSAGSSGGLSASAGSPPAASDQTGGFSAASLVDPDALPEWLKPAQSGPLPSGSAPLNRGSAPPASQSDAGWGEYSSGEQGGLSAASLVDPNELPEWMRSQEGLQRPGSQPLDGGAEEAPQARVPRRPHLSAEPDRAPSQAAASVFSSVLGPSAGEDQRNQPFGGLSSSSREMPAVDRSNPFSALSSASQGQDWGSSESGWNQQPGSSQAGGAFGAFEGEQGRGFDQGSAGGDWPGSYGGRGMADEPPERDRSSYRALGPLSDSQHMRRVAPPGEPEDEMNGPLTRRQAGRTRGDAGFGMAEGQGQEFSGGRGYEGFPPGPQGRGPQGGYGYRQEYEGWEGGPGYEQGYMDDEVGPPSGMFAKLKRMLGFGK